MDTKPNSVTLVRPHNSYVCFTSREGQFVELSFEFKSLGFLITASVNNVIIDQEFRNYHPVIETDTTILVSICQEFFNKALKKEENKTGNTSGVP